MPFTKSDLGAQASWKGYSSQTLYIAVRIVEDIDSLEYYPEQLEDLLIKSDGEVSEVVQIKDLGSDLSISSLASTSASLKNEGFFRRVLSLRKSESKRLIAKVVHFGELGDELNGFINGVTTSLESIRDKLVKNHNLLLEEAEWITERMVFEKVDKEALQLKIAEQIKGYIPTMIAPTIMQDLLIQYVSDLSRAKGYTSKSIWQEKIHKIGRDMAAIDGYFREYGSSLIRLSDIENYKSYEEMKSEYEQGISAHPAHIRFSLDFERINWLKKIEDALAVNKAVIIKGASGQGKSSLSYKYLIKNYAEELVFCVRQIQTQGQAENLVKAILGLTNHSTNIILYIDVNPGQIHWTWLIRELQVRGVTMPVIISIREEDFKQSNVDMNEVAFELIELTLSEEEAMNIYNKITMDNPHASFRTFEDAWQQFGHEGPLLEFVYLLNNNESLKQRLSTQIDHLIDESVDDTWLNLLLLVCYVGKLDGCILFDKALQAVKCTNAIAALKRLSDEYLIRSSLDGNYIESLHSLRADIIYSILQNRMVFKEKDLLLQSLSCVENQFPQMLLLHYFFKNEIDVIVISDIARIHYVDWVSYGRTLNTMLWLDVKQYVEQNREIFERIFAERGAGWLPFAPMDITGEILPGEFAAAGLVQLNAQILPYLEEIKKSLISFTLSYSITDRWLELSSIPQGLPSSDLEWSNLGYTLFWAALRKKKLIINFSYQEIVSFMKEGNLESKIDASLGFYKQGFSELYALCEVVLRERLIQQFNVLLLDITESNVQCRFVPPYFQQNNENEKQKNLNHYWTMNMVNFLSRLYPEKESISVKLIGVDLLSDLGIKPFDFEKKIAKEHRPDRWITEVNSWLVSRIELTHRPNDWISYLDEVYVLRKLITETLHEFIYLVDNLYKKRYWDNVKAKRTMTKIESLKKSLLKDFLLPKTVLDPYGLHSESLASDSMPQIINISIQPYKNFRKSFREMISGIHNFFNQFEDILVSRIKNEEIKSDLSLINIYESSKALSSVQKEFRTLFKSYVDHNYSIFADEEIEGMLTALNVWESVLNQKPRGFILSYNARQMYKKSESIIFTKFEEAIVSLGPKISVISREMEGKSVVKFLLYEDSISETNTIEEQYKLLCGKLHKSWITAVKFNSSRWILETHWPKIVFVPLYKGLPILSGFDMPMYRVVDMNVDPSSPMIPVEIPLEVYSLFGLDTAPFTEWRDAIANVGRLRLIILQFNQAIDEIVDHQHSIAEGFSAYLNMLLLEVARITEDLNGDFIQNITALSYYTEPEVLELLNIIINGLSDLNNIVEHISSVQKINDIPEILQEAVTAMILVTPYLKRIE